MSFNIIVKDYQHFNNSMGKYITSKHHYDNEMAKGGYIPYEKAQAIAESVKNRQRKYELSPKAKAVIESAKNSTDSKGKVHYSDRLKQGMKEVGVKFGYYDQLPKHYRVDMGGFENAS